MEGPTVIHIQRTLYILFYLFCIVSSWLFDSPGEVKPDNPYVFFGEDLELQCSLNTVEYNSSQLRFTYGTDVAVPPENVAIVSDTTAVMTLTVTDMTQFQGVMFNCWAAETFVGSQVITVEYASRPVTGMQCVVSNWETMLCSWSIGPYADLDNINVMLHWTMTGALKWSSCSTLTNTSCLWDESNFPKMDDIKMNITVSNKKKTSVASAIFTVKANEIVKPSAVRQLAAETVDSRCVDLRWTHTHSSKGIVYRVNYTDGATSVTAVNNRTLDNYRVCDLSPFTDYTFFVEVHPSTARGFWSDSTQTPSKTAQDVPTVGPNVTSGSYVDECVNGKRNVILYFKAPQERFRNGILTGYKVNFKKRESGVTYSEFVSAEQMTVRLKLKCDTLYDVDLFALTNVGASKTSSTITINRYAAVPAPMLFRVQTTGNGSPAVTAKWNDPDDKTTLTTTVFWCKQLQSSNICKEPFDWIVVKNRNEVKLPLENVQNYLFAISRDTTAGSSGMTWNHCIYQFNKRPDAPDDVRVSNGGRDLTLNVMWNGQWCNSNRMSLLSKYIIHFNAVGSTEPNTSVPVEPFDSNYELSGLTNVNYSVWMQAESDNGTLGPISQPVFGVPVDNRLTTGEIVGIAFGCFCGLFFIGAGIFFLIRLCKHGCRRDQISFPREKKFILDYLVPDNNVNGVYTMKQPDEDVEIECVNGKPQPVPKSDPVIDRQISTVSTDSGRGSLQDGKKSGGTSPLSSIFPPLKEDEEWTKVSTDSVSSGSVRSPDCSRFAKEEDCNLPQQDADDLNLAQQHKTVGFLLDHSKEVVINASAAASGKRSEPVSGHSVDPYVTVGNDGNVEVSDSSNNSFAVPETDSGNSIDPYMVITDDGKITAADKSFEFGDTKDRTTEKIASSDGSSSDKPNSGNSIDPYMVITDDGKITAADKIIESGDTEDATTEKMTSSDGSSSDKPNSGNSFDPYMIITDDGKITPAKVNIPSNDKIIESGDIEDATTDQMTSSDGSSSDKPNSKNSVDPYMIITDDGKITPAKVTTPSNDTIIESGDIEDVTTDQMTSSDGSSSNKPNSRNSVDPYMFITDDGKITAAEISTPKDENIESGDTEDETTKMTSSNGSSPDKPDSGNSVDPYMIITDDGKITPAKVTTPSNDKIIESVNIEDATTDKMTSSDGSSSDKPNSRNSVDPYMFITEDGKITPAEDSTPSRDNNTDFGDTKDPDKLDQKSAASHSQAADQPDQFNNHLLLHNKDSTQDEDKSDKELSSAEIRGPPVLQHGLSPSAQDSQPSLDTNDVRQDETSDPPYVANFSPCINDADSSDFMGSTSDQIHV